MKKVFLSYAREDLKIAKKIYNDLAGKGINVWLDDNALIPGQNWRYEITQAIRGSNYFLALLSSNSVSKIGYVQKELKMALDILDNYPQDKIFIIPVRVDDCEPVDEKLGDLHWADLSADYEAGIQKIMHVLATLENEALQSDADTAIPSEEKEKPAVIKVTKPTEPVTSVKPSVRLRSRAATLSDYDAEALLERHNFFDSRWNKSGDFKNDFQDKGNGTVTDRKTGLMWQQSGSDASMQYKDTDDYVRQLNNKGLADYNDWRLPTLEELASLLESQKMIDPVFDKKQDWCWSSDKRAPTTKWVWDVDFYYGEVDWRNLDRSSYVRAVRVRQ